MLDIYTVLLTGVALSLPLAVMLRIGVPHPAPGRSRESRAIALWWQALGAHALFWLLFVAFLGNDHAFWVVLINTLSVLAVTLYVAAIGSFLGLRLPGWAIPVTVGVVAVGNLVFASVLPDFGLRALTVSGANLLWLGWGAFLLMRHNEAPIHRAATLLMIVLVVFALTLLMRTLEVLMHDVHPGADSIPQQITLAAYALFPIYASIAFFLMLGARGNERLAAQARTDDLTGVLTRRAFLGAAQQQLNVTLAFDSRPVSLLLLDLDHFKAINDTYGHAAGDEVLRRFCERLDRELRNSDLVGRLGGEEFAVLLAGADRAQALEVAERLRKATRETRLHENPEHRLSVSIGVAEWHGSPATLNQLLRDADQAMYRAKADGRNRVTADDAERAMCAVRDPAS